MSKNDPSRLANSIGNAIDTVIAAPIQAHSAMHGRLQASAASLIPNLVKAQASQISNIKSNRNALADLHDSLLMAQQLQVDMKSCINKHSNALEHVLSQFDD